MRSILVLRGGALGDFIVTLPALAALRRQWPSARIELSGNATAATLARNRRLVDVVHSQHDARWSSLYSQTPLSAEFGAWLAAFDLVVSYWPDPDGDLRSRFPLRASQQFVSSTALPDVAPAAAHFTAALHEVGASTTATFHRLEPLAEEHAETDPATAVLLSDRYDFAVHPGSGAKTKNWPADRWAELLPRLPGRTVVIVGEAENGTWESILLHPKIREQVRGGSLKVAAQFSLENVVRLMGRCRRYLGHDSGISHLAAACGLPCGLLFGPSDAKVWAPPSPDVRVLLAGDRLASLPVDDVADFAGSIPAA